MAEASLVLLLHCHLPYVRHPEHEEFLEEDWFFESMAETYLPLVLMLQRLSADGVPFSLTLSLSPTLCEMMSNELLQERCVRYLRRHVELAGREVDRRAGSAFEEVARMYERHYGEVLDAYENRLARNPLPAFGALAEAGHVELIGSAATHAILPLMGSEAARHAQLAAGMASFERHFGHRPRGFWLPECGYESSTEGRLAEFGLGFFFLETHGLLMARPEPPYGVFAPLRTPAGPRAFGRDVETGKQVWSATEGYPGDPAYREFHRDLGYDAEWEYVEPYLHGAGRHPLGLKYHRVTGDVPLHEKKPYLPAPAAERAREHARHFVSARLEQVHRIGQAAGIAPVIVSPYDAELFGHWWWEGLQFLEQVFRLAAPGEGLSCRTPSAVLAEEAQARREQRGVPAQSSWGEGGYFDTWVNGATDWMYPQLRRAEEAMAGAAGRFPTAKGTRRRALDQCARELLLAQSSDWPFLIYTRTAPEYAESRFRDLMGRFQDLLEQVHRDDIDRDLLERCERRDDAFPQLDYRIFTPETPD